MKTYSKALKVVLMSYVLKVFLTENVGIKMRMKTKRKVKLGNTWIGWLKTEL